MKVPLNTHFFRDIANGAVIGATTWEAFYAYATTESGSLIPGICPPTNGYHLGNYYCTVNQDEPTLNASNCGPVSRAYTPIPCEPVEAYIDTNSLPSPLLPVFYRCYWKAKANITPVGTTIFEVVEFEWSATVDWIRNWIAANPGGTKCPLLCVTNHTPN
jgi:hypothetical protein